MLRATAAFIFSTCQLPKVLQAWCVLHVFPTASERRVLLNLLIVGVCFTSSHIIFAPSHLHILSSHIIFASSRLHIQYHLHIFTSSHLHIISSHLHIFTSSLSLCLSLSISLSHEVPKTVVKLQFNILDGNPFARNEVRSPKAVEKLRFVRFGGNPFARNEVRSSKPGVKLQLCASAAALSHAMRFDRQNRGVKLQLCASSFHLPVSSQFFFLRLLRFIFLLFLLQVCLPFFNV